MTKSPIPLLHDQTCDNKGNSDIGYSIGTRRGYPLHIPDKRAAAEGGG
ncbi:unknown [Alistipes putredinis CAG:67]|nr:unknown [Alistipes putredinis CAG:67]